MALWPKMFLPIPLPAPLPVSFLLKTKIHLLPLYSAYTLIVKFTVKLRVCASDGRV